MALKTALTQLLASSNNNLHTFSFFFKGTEHTAMSTGINCLLFVVVLEPLHSLLGGQKMLS